MSLIDDDVIAAYRRFHRHPLNKLAHAIGIPAILISLILAPFAPLRALAFFIAGWGLQFAGHTAEGVAPKFVDEPRFLLVGPLLLARSLAGRS